MTDHMPDSDPQVDARLTAAGARWRAAQPAPPQPDPALLAAPDRSGRPRWQPLAAAAAVVAVAVGGVAVSRAASDSPPAGRLVGQTAAPATDDVVRDGDRVAGQGTVVARDGEPVRLCLTEPQLDTGTARAGTAPGPAGRAPTAPTCRTGVAVTGLDLARLSDRQQAAGVVWGTARVEGTFRAGTVAVEEQGAFQQPPRPDAGADDPVPCAAPAGGWTRQPAGIEAALPRLSQVIGANSAELTDVFVRYPYGWHLQDTSDRKGTEVYVVGTTGDVAAARRQLERVFPAAHLCVTEVKWSRDAMRAAERALLTPAARAAGIGGPNPELLKDRVGAELVVLDERAATFLAGVAEGRVQPQPLLAKVR